jgi:hypothetical protein
VKALARFWRAHGTKVLGYVAAAIPSLMTIQGLIPALQRKWWEAAGILVGLMVVHRGHQNSVAAKQRATATNPGGESE